MSKFRKRPVEIEALQWDGQNYGELQSFVGEARRMTDTQWLLDLVEGATPGPGNYIGNFDQDRALLLAKDRIAALAPDLARLCVEQHEALALLARGDAVPPELLLDQVKLVLARSLASFAELKP